jgi:hypothetical protein
MSEAVVTAMTQFGAAGLIGLLWLLERRHAATRDRQIDAAHQTIMDRDRAVDSLLAVIKENTRAIIRLEQSQHRLIGLLERWRPGRAPAPTENPR